MSPERIIVVGAGVFGLSAAVELARRGYAVELFEAGAVPNPLAGSTDISKVCRLEYGSDETYMQWMEQAREIWLEWNAAWRGAGERPLYHETGVLMVSLDTMQPGSFEYESFRMLERRGHTPERIGGRELVRRFPAWSPTFEDGFYHAKGGWAESGRVVEFLAAQAVAHGVALHSELPVAAVDAQGGAVRGVRTADRRQRRAERVVLACGSWAAELAPGLGPSLCRSYHPVWHLRATDSARFAPERFPVFTADISNTGFYGFPVHPEAEVVKVAHHGVAVEAPEDDSLTVSGELTMRLREFLRARMPALADAEVVSTRLCPYCDTQDEHFWIADDPDCSGLTLATGGSGHGFKFTPLLGAVIADAIEGVANPLLDRFTWRPELRMDFGLEASRCHSRGDLE